jgi:hypothetical protein
MTLDPHEFIRRFLMHVLPKGFHRIRHYGLFANDTKDVPARPRRIKVITGVERRCTWPAEELAPSPCHW